MEPSLEKGRYVGDVWYETEETPNFVSHQISHPPGASTMEGLIYEHPAAAGKDVVVYVMEKTMGYIDLPYEHAQRIKTLLWDKNSSWNSQTSSWENKPSSKPSHWAKLNPIRESDGHGARVLDLLTGATVGAAKACTVYTVGRDEKTTGEPNWASSLSAVAKHFEDLKQGNQQIHGVMNLSVGMKNVDVTKKALDEVIAAGIIVVGAAGNESIADAYLPEAIRDKVIIIGALDQNEDIAKISNHGQRVDYWLGGINLQTAVKDRNGGAPQKFEDNQGTSFSTPIATGVIAGMLSAGQVPTRRVNMVQRSTVEDVRARLDEWASVNILRKLHLVTGQLVEVRLKHLKNAPGLN